MREKDKENQNGNYDIIDISICLPNHSDTDM